MGNCSSDERLAKIEKDIESIIEILNKRKPSITNSLETLEFSLSAQKYNEYIIDNVEIEKEYIVLDLCNVRNCDTTIKIIYTTSFVSQISMQNIKKNLINKKITSTCDTNIIGNYYFNGDQLNVYIEKLKNIFGGFSPSEGRDLSSENSNDIYNGSRTNIGNEF